MAVGILVITHGLIGAQITETACSTLGSCPLPIENISIPDHDRDIGRISKTASSLLQRLDDGDGVIILTDLFGATPSNVASELLRPEHVVMISGISLPMLIRIMNYPDLPLRELADKALSGAHDGAFITTHAPAP